MISTVPDSRPRVRADLGSRACENGMFIASANRAGEEPSYSFCGDSMIVGPNAELYTNLEEPVEGYAVATIDLDDVRRAPRPRRSCSAGSRSPIETWSRNVSRSQGQIHTVTTRSARTPR